MERSEALTQLARLLSDERARESAAAAAEAVERGLDRLADALTAEAAASDDVVDRESAMVYLDDRIAFFGPLLDETQRSRLRQALMERVATW